MKFFASILAFPLMLIFGICILLMIMIFWSLGQPITISVRDKKIGELRWFKYTPVS